MMLKRISIVVLSLLTLLTAGISSAFAVNTPNAPVNVSAVSNSAANAQPSTGSLSVTWQRPNYDATHPIPIAYIVSAIGGGQTFSTTVPLATIATTDYSTVVTGLTGGTAYAITVTSKSSENATAVSSSVNATPITSPGTPTTVSAVATPGSVALTWSAPSNSGGSAITGYVIKDGAGTETNISDPAATTKTFTGLTGGSTASYSIRAKNANGSSEWAAFAAATLPSAPDKPTGITATAGTSSITASWVAPTITGNSAITGYKVYLYDSTGTAVGSPTSATTTTIEIRNLSPGTYTVKVIATNLVGDSPLSSASTATTIAPPSALLDNTPVFAPATLPNLVISATQSVAATVPSGGEVTITATGTPVGACTYAAGTLTAVAVGTCSVRVTSPATSTYADGIGTKTFSITKTLQTITFAAIANQPLPGPLTLAATSTSGLTVAFATAGNCTVTGTTLSFISEGTCTVTATQVGNATYAAATQVVRTFSITAAVSSGGGSSGGGSSGGGSSGGGNNPGPTPTVGPIPAPLVTAKPTPTPTPTPTPSVSATPTPTPVVTPTSVATPKASPSPSGVKVLGDNLSVTPLGVKITGSVTPSTLSAGITNVSLKASTNLQPVLPAVKLGDKVTMVIKDSKGKSYTVANLIAPKAGTLKLPAVKFAQKGNYTITIKAGLKTKVLNVKSQ